MADPNLTRLYNWCKTHEIASVGMLDDAVVLKFDVLFPDGSWGYETALVRTLNEARDALGY